MINLSNAFNLPKAFGIYLWDQMVYHSLVNDMFTCFFLGGWNLFWNDDDVLFINECLRL